MQEKLDPKKILSDHQIKPSHQRIKILEYLISHKTHPTVDQIFVDLHNEIPTLSKSTVYNTLGALEQGGLVRTLAIDDNESRYDLIITKDHGHIKCERCGTIYDFDFDMDQFSPTSLAGFQINEKSIYFKGICPSCLK